MAEEELIRDFEEARERYVQLFERLVEAKVPGVIDPVAAKCSVGEVCHGGTFRTPMDLGRPPEIAPGAPRG